MQPSARMATSAHSARRRAPKSTARPTGWRSDCRVGCMRAMWPCTAPLARSIQMGSHGLRMTSTWARSSAASACSSVGQRRRARAVKPLPRTAPQPAMAPLVVRRLHTSLTVRRPRVSLLGSAETLGSMRTSRMKRRRRRRRRRADVHGRASRAKSAARETARAAGSSAAPTRSSRERGMAVGTFSSSRTRATQVAARATAARASLPSLR